MTSSLKRTPVFERHLALGAKMSDFGGWEMPIEYPGGGVLKEHAAVRERVGLFDVSHLGKMSVRGDGARDFVNGQLTNDLRRITPGQAQYSMLCDASGGVIDDLIVYLRADDDVFAVPNAANTAEVVSRLVAAAPEGVGVENEHDDYGVLAVQGPRADAVMQALALPHGGEYMGFVEAEFEGTPLIVCRTGYTGERGYELIPTWNSCLALWDALVPAVEEQGGRPAGLGARDTLRTEMGYPLHGQDLSLTITPVQARAGWAVGWDKPSFSGRDALVAEREAGPRRRSWGLLARDRGIPRQHMEVRDSAGAVIGEVTSGTFSPTLRTGIGLALLDAAASEAGEVGEGAEVTVDVRGRPTAMTVVRPPFVDASPR